LQETTNELNNTKLQNEKLEKENKLYLLERDDRNKNQELINFKYFEL
jgi:hypothetical protein